ncbi:MAG TPA: hypothetical protein VMM78_16840 [Thermomicrobiales bacterium]|nr:hypothetical protein [Thermomicrobiales bacterium]
MLERAGGRDWMTVFTYESFAPVVPAAFLGPVSLSFHNRLVPSGSLLRSADRSA